MKSRIILFLTCSRRVGLLLLAIYVFGVPVARAGLTFNLYFYRNNQGLNYSFYTPLGTNALSPAAQLGTYTIYSPQWPTNGSVREFQLTAAGLADVNSGDTENFYSDFNSAMQQITNGMWKILFTNSTTTNFYTFTVSAPNMTSNMLPATIITFPMDGSIILTSQTNLTWQGPPGWPANANASVYDFSGYYQFASLPATQENWNVPPFLVGSNYDFNLDYVATNTMTPLFQATVPLSTNNFQPISGWVSNSILETGTSVGFSTVADYGVPSSGHTLLAYYTFEDDNLFAQDFSGNDNNVYSYGNYSMAPYITNNAEAGNYAFGASGDGWLYPATNLLTTLAGSFSVSLWLDTTNVHGRDTDDQYSAGGIVSALTGDSDNAVMPMGQVGTKVAFYTGGSQPNLLRSQSDINTGHYVHLVVSRDQLTGEKRIYINGVLDSDVYSSTDLLNGAGTSGLTIGYNNGQTFDGDMDEIQFYSGVLSSSEVTYLYNHPGTNVANTLELGVPLARFDFEDTNNPGNDSSGHNNNASGSDSFGQLDIASTNSTVGLFARQYFGQTRLDFYPGTQCFPGLSNALSGTFSVTAWVNTTNTVNSDFANAYFGNPILFAYSGNTNSTIPMTITGSKAAFTIYDQNGVTTTIHSTTTVNDGNYHLITVTRTQTNGLMSLYVDGNLEATGMSTTQSLVISTFYIAGGYYVQYTGLLDDVRIYSFALASNDVVALAASGPTLANALNAPNLLFTTDGDTSWFVETTNTYNGTPAAAQSGSVTNFQTTTLSTTVTGPGTLTFYWSSIANDPNEGFDYEFYIDDPNNGDMADLYGDNDWQSIEQTTGGGPILIPAGQHTLGWIVYAFGDTDPTQAGFLDNVNYVQSLPSAVVLLNPQISGTNLQFSFQTQSGFTHNVLYSTNLVSGAWQTYTNFPADGTTYIISIPLSIFSPSKQGFVRVTTQ
jgi:hypothetical protein